MASIVYRRNPVVIKFLFPRVSLATNRWPKSLRTLDTRLPEKRHEHGLIFRTAAGNQAYVNTVNIINT